MDEQQPKRGGIGRFLWLFVLIAIVLLWWYFRPDGATHAQAQSVSADAMAALDPDDILVDLKDDATPEMITAIERDVGVKLTLVDRTAAATKLYRAHVDPAQQGAILEKL